MTTTVDPPGVLPVANLSVSSLNTLSKCPLRWKRRYLDREYEPPSGRMILGSAAGAAEAQHYSQVIETGDGFTVEQVCDEFDREWEDRRDREEIDWGEEKPGELKDQGVAALSVYHEKLAPIVRPVSVEREFLLSWEGVDWGLLGYLDLEEEDGSVGDLKMRGRRLFAHDAAVDLQPAAYLYARRAEGDPASTFRFHTMVRGKRPHAEIVPTSRTDRQLDAFADRVFLAASEIAWRAEQDCWTGAPPGAWWCGQKMCGFWHSCPFGGLR